MAVIFDKWEGSAPVLLTVLKNERAKSPAARSAYVEIKRMVKGLPNEKELLENLKRVKYDRKAERSLLEAALLRDRMNRGPVIF